MRAIIVGGGRFGFSIAQTLTVEKYDVTVIERDMEKLSTISDQLDVNVINGNGASLSLLNEAGVSETDVLIAVTGIDEINLVSCMLAKQLGVTRTIARVKNLEYMELDSAGNKFNGVDMVINPELETAKEILKLVEIPEALDVIYAFEKRAIILELPVKKTSVAAGRKIKDIKTEYPLLIVAIVRKEKVIVPSGSDVIEAGDTIYALTKTEEVVHIEDYLGLTRTDPDRIMVLGGGRTGGYLAELLEKRDYNVRVIDNDRTRCEKLAEKLENSLVLHGDATDLEMLASEGAEYTDIVISVTSDDKVNLLASLVAKRLGAKKTIAQVRRSDYIDLIQSVGIDIGVSPRMVSTNAIMSFLRNNRSLKSLTFLHDEQAGIMEFEINKDSKACNIMIKDLHLPYGCLVGAIKRKEQIIIAKGKDSLKPGDIVTIFSLKDASESLMEYFD